MARLARAISIMMLRTAVIAYFALVGMAIFMIIRLPFVVIFSLYSVLPSYTTPPPFLRWAVVGPAGIVRSIL